MPACRCSGALPQAGAEAEVIGWALSVSWQCTTIPAGRVVGASRRRSSYAVEHDAHPDMACENSQAAEVDSLVHPPRREPGALTPTHGGTRRDAAVIVTGWLI